MSTMNINIAVTTRVIPSVYYWNIQLSYVWQYCEVC